MTYAPSKVYAEYFYVPRHQTKEKRRTNNAKTNAEYDTTIVQTKNNFNRGFAFERSVGNKLGVWGVGAGGGWLKAVLLA